MEYTERVRKKDGTRIVTCRFVDLLKEAFNVQTEEEIKNFQKPNGEFICHCPFCKAEGHTKHKLYISDDFSVGHCFVCGRAFININDKLDFEIKEFDFLDPDPSSWGVVPYKDVNRYFDYSQDNESGLNYLMKRHGFLGELSKCLNFRYTDEGDVVIPFVYHGNVIYYQIRSIKNSKLRRYWLPPMPTGTKPPYIIENGDNKRIIVCEGVFDAISLLVQAPDWTPIAVLGSTISDYQLGFLREYVPEEIVVYMDDTEKSRFVQRKIKSVIDYCPVTIIESDGTDPEEVLKKKLNWATEVSQLQIKKLKRT